MKHLYFLYGLFFALPLTALNILPAGIKIDDIFMLVILLTYLLSNLIGYSKVRINRNALIFIVITLIFTLIAFIVSVFASFEPLGDTPLTVFFRVLQSLLIILIVAIAINEQSKVSSLFNGIVLGTSISLFVFLAFFITHLSISNFVSRGVYFTKDIFQYGSYLPFSIHVNTLGSFFLISFFILYYNLSNRRYLAYLFLLPSLFLIAKGDLFALSVFFSCIMLRKIKNKSILILFSIMLLCVASPFLYEQYLALAQYRVYSSGRNEIYASALYGIFNSPVGYGLGSQNNIIYEMTGINYPAHNIILSIALEFGVLYLAILILFLMVWMFNCKSKDAMLVFLAFFIIGLFGNSMYFYKYHVLALIISFYSIWSLRKYENSHPIK